MIKTPHMTCMDGKRRADNGCFSRETPTAKTADYTVLAHETGKTFSNSGAGGAVVFTLPTPKAGMWFLFLKLTQENLSLQAPTGVSINGGTAGKIYENVAAENNKSCLVMGINETAYAVVAERGTWVNNNA